MKADTRDSKPRGPHRVAQFLTEVREQILQEWENLAREKFAAARTVDSVTIRNSLPVFLDHLIRSLTDLESNETGIQEEKSLAREHGQQLSQIETYDLTLLIDEYNLLRRVITRKAWEEGQLSFQEISIIQDAIDIGIRNTSSEFVRIRHSEVEMKNANLRTSDEQLRIVMSGVRDHAIIQLAPDNTILDWSHGAENVLGFQKAEVLGQKGSITFTSEDLAGC